MRLITSFISIFAMLAMALGLDLHPTPTRTQQDISFKTHHRQVSRLAAQQQLATVDWMTIPLAGDMSQDAAEISGLDWYGDKLIILPQYPGRYTTNANAHIYALNRQDIITHIQNPSGTLTPQPMRFYQESIETLIAGFEGFEGIAFAGDVFYVLAEYTNGTEIGSYIVKGEVINAGTEFHLLPATRQKILSQSGLTNLGDESIAVYGDSVLTFHETYYSGSNPTRVVYQFAASDLSPQGALSFPDLTYRVADATRVHPDGSFWLVNTFFPLGGGLPTVYFERLIEYQVTAGGIVQTDTEPIDLTMNHTPPSAFDQHNWEGLAELDGYGFLLITDPPSSTIFDIVFGFVPYENLKWKAFIPMQAK